MIRGGISVASIAPPTSRPGPGSRDRSRARAPSPWSATTSSSARSAPDHGRPGGTAALASFPPDSSIATRRSGALLAALTAASIVAELRSLPRADVAFLLFAAARVLDGAPPLRGHRRDQPAADRRPQHAGRASRRRALGLQPALVYRLAVFALLGLSLAASSGCYCADCCRASHRFAVASSCSWRLVLFPMPGLDFGEREHLMLALILPYVWLVGTRGRGVELPRRTRRLVGVSPGVGFALKPHFLPVWRSSRYTVAGKRARRLVRTSPESLAVARRSPGLRRDRPGRTPEYFTMVQTARRRVHPIPVRATGTSCSPRRVPRSRCSPCSPSLHSALTRAMAGSGICCWPAALRRSWAACSSSRAWSTTSIPPGPVAILLLGVVCLDVPLRLERLSARAYRVVAAAAVLDHVPSLLSARRLDMRSRAAGAGVMDAPLEDRLT